MKRFLLGSLFLLSAVAQAQTPDWTMAVGCGQLVNTASNGSGGCDVTAVASDAAGNLFVAGNFVGQIKFGSMVLTSAGQSDIFVAKYVPATTSWAWAQTGGGTENDLAWKLAVSGNSVYVTGYFAGNTTNATQMRLGGTGSTAPATPIAGTGPTVANNLLLAKYTDNGSSATLGWAQVVGGNAGALGQAVAVSGSRVYVTGSVTNDAANTAQVMLGSNGSTAGTVPLSGTSATLSNDMLLVCYQDNGTSATPVWAQVAGGTGGDIGTDVAVSGSNVYMAGTFRNNTANASAVLFGGSGTTPGTVQVNGATATNNIDLVLAKYTDNGNSATLGWTQVAGGTRIEENVSVAVSGSNVYVSSTMYNDRANTYGVVFGGGGTVAGTSPQHGATTAAGEDLVLAKYTDQGSQAVFGWSQVGGGYGTDRAYGVVAKGANVYVAGTFVNNLANGYGVVFGGSGTTAGTAVVNGISSGSSVCALLNKCIDNGATGSYQWSRIAGDGMAASRVYSLTLSGQHVVVGGSASSATTTFGPITVQNTSNNSLGILARVTDPALPLAVAPVASVAGLTLYPNPASGTTTLTGSQPGAAVQVFDAQGRLVAAATADASGQVGLRGLSPGLYLVRAGTSSARLVMN